jgi:hypothetical protein
VLTHAIRHTQLRLAQPALVEISIYPDKKVEVVIDLSLEAAMTGIGTQYKNTEENLLVNRDRYTFFKITSNKC